MKDQRGSDRAAPASTHFGHPSGLFVLALTEAGERFSFYGMQSLLVLYLVRQLLLPGHKESVIGLAGLESMLSGAGSALSPQALSSYIFGLFTGLAFLLLPAGGFIGDRWLGRHQTVMLGAMLMAAGQVALVFEQPFLIGLALLILGTGLLKGNIATQVGALYPPGDRRQTDAFQIFTAISNVGSVLAPLICGSLGEMAGWRYGFIAASVGMLLALTIYALGRKLLPPDTSSRGAADRSSHSRLTAADAPRIVALAVVLVVVTSFLIPMGQLGNAYVLWILASVDRSAGTFVIPVTWFLSLSALLAVMLTPALLRVWRWQSSHGREQGNVSKLGWGCLIGALCHGLLALLSPPAATGVGVTWAWLVGYQLAFAVAILYVWPVGMALFVRAAPVAIRSTCIGLYYLALFAANNLAGWLGHYYESLGAQRFWTLQALIAGSGTVLVLIFGRTLRRNFGAVDSSAGVQSQ